MSGCRVGIGISMSVTVGGRERPLEAGSAAAYLMPVGGARINNLLRRLLNRARGDA